MSEWGLLVKDKNGNANLNPDSFTVRLVETVWLFVNYLAPSSVVDIPTSVNVLAGMFPVITVNEQFSDSIKGYPNWQTWVNASIYPDSVPLTIPIVEVYNGLVRVRGQPFEGSVSHGYLTISIMAYI